MKVFIIGGTGLISTAISSQLAARGDEVVLFNRGISRNRAQGRQRVIVGDRNNEESLAEALARELPDAVIDMVAYAPSQAEALIRASKGKTPQLVVCSSVCVYGGPLSKLPADESEPHRPVGDYGRNKSTIESIVLSRSGPGGEFGTVMRPSYSTGEGASIGGLVFDDSTVNRLREGLPVLIMDDGKAAWAISHVSDVARGFVASLGNPLTRAQAYNLTSDEHSNWDGVFQAMADAAKAPAPKFVHIPSPWLYAQAPRRCVGIQYIFRHPSVFDNRKAARDLGFKTTVSLLETFRRQITWMEEEGLLKASASEQVQDELSAAWLEKRDIVPGRFEDKNSWGNSTTG
jgi:nucleoside-diphosphate-sugar epimerase